MPSCYPWTCAKALIYGAPSSDDGAAEAPWHSGALDEALRECLALSNGMAAAWTLHEGKARHGDQ